jgi:hypothetical protein
MSAALCLVARAARVSCAQPLLRTSRCASSSHRDRSGSVPQKRAGGPAVTRGTPPRAPPAAAAAAAGPPPPTPPHVATATATATASAADASPLPSGFSLISYFKTLPWSDPPALVRTVAANPHVRAFVKAYAVLYITPAAAIAVRVPPLCVCARAVGWLSVAVRGGVRLRSGSLRCVRVGLGRRVWVGAHNSGRCRRRC